MDPGDLQRIRAACNGGRVQAFRCADGRCVMVKWQRPARGRLGPAMLHVLATCTGVRLLRSAASAGAAQQAAEVRRLRELQAAGVRVPGVLHVDEDFIVMEHLAGPDLAHALRENGRDACALWDEGLGFILDAHRLGQYLGDASTRNLLLTPQGVAAVDFDDDPLQVMPLADAQARDWLLYLNSTLWRLHADPWQLLALWNRVILGDHPRTRERVRHAVRRLAWLRALPRARNLGRDAMAAQAAAAFLAAWEWARPFH